VRWVAWLFGFSLVLLACGDDDGSKSAELDAGPRPGAAGSAGVKPRPGMPQPEQLGDMLGKPQPLRQWTVLIYGHADHTLSNGFVRDIAEMARAEISEDVQVIVFADFDASQEIANSADHFPSGAQWLRVTGSGEVPEALGEERELNLDDPEVLAGVVATAFGQFPAQHHALILWDHGGSWKGGFGCDSQDGRLDAETCRRMTPQEVAGAVASGLQAAKLTGERPLDIFSFDTCLMAGTEVAWEFKDLAQTYIANAEIDYGDGWDYNAFLSYLSQHPGAGARELAKIEVQQWNAHHERASFNDVLLRSHVAIDTKALDGFGRSLRQFVADWRASEQLSGIELGRASYFSLPPYMNQIDNPQSEPELRDLGLFLDKMIAVSDSQVSASANAARAALESAIIARSQGTLREASRQIGVHIELPLAAAMTADLMHAYDARAAGWIAASGWRDALDAYAALADDSAPSIDATISNAEDPDAQNLPTIDFSIADSDVADAEVVLAGVDRKAGVLVFFGVVAKSSVEVGESYRFRWDGQLNTLLDAAGNEQAVEVVIWEDVGVDGSGAINAPVLAIYGMLSGPDGDQHLAVLLYQDGDQEVGVMALLDQPVTLLLGEIASDFPGSTFTPIYESASLSDDAQDTLLGEPIRIDRASLRLSRASAAAGNYGLVTLAHDVFGNTGLEAQVVSVLTPIEP
jgi:hypothetical protein